MNKLLDYKDPVLLVETGQNEWGDIAAVHTEQINGLFVQGTSQNQVGNVEAIGTDAHIYLDIENPFVQENAFRLEDMYILANPFGGRDKQSWYKISRCKVGQRKLLDNDINNVHCFLTKCAAIPLSEES